MEQVIAYKAFNGRLFDTEDKCIAYEKKMSQYPKVKETITKAADSYLVGGQYRSVDIIRHTIETWDKPSHKKIDKYFIVGGKYKFIDKFGKHEVSVMNGGVFPNGGDLSMNWYLAFRHFAEQILLGHELTDEFIQSKINMMNEINDVKLAVNVIEPNKKWEIDNPKWTSGAVAPYTFTIEKIN